MRSRLFRRRSAAAAGLYTSVALGVLGTIVAARMLGLQQFGVFATVLAAAGFFQTLLDLTVEESLTKYGFRYVGGEQWGKLQRLFRRALELKLLGGALAALALALLAPIADAVFDGSGLALPMFLAGGIALAQAPENVAATALLLRGRYDLRATCGAVSMAFRLIAIAVGVQFGVTETIALMVVAQVLATGVVGAAGLAAFRRYPRAMPEPLGEDRPEIVSFVAHSTIATGIVAARAMLAPLLLGTVAGPTQVGLFRIAQAPQTGLIALSSPVRLVQLTEQTASWEGGRRRDVLAQLRRYMVAAAALMAVAVPVFLLLMPWLIRVVFGGEYADATTAARIILFAGALQFVFAWTKTLPVSIGRPNLRVITHGIETVMLLALVLTLGAHWGVTGAAWGVLASTSVFAALWALLLARLHVEVRADPVSGAVAAG